MANHPCFGIQDCPHCKRPVPVIWNGNQRIPCPFCSKAFRIKRQKLRKTQMINTKLLKEEGTA